MKTLIVLALCFTACFAHGNSEFRINRGGGSNLIDYPFTVETRTTSGTGRGNTGANFGYNNGYQTQPQQQRPQIAPYNPQQNNQRSSRARTQYVEIPVIVESISTSQRQISRPQPISRNIQYQPQPQIRQVTQPQQFRQVSQPQPQQFRQVSQPQPQFRQVSQPQQFRQVSQPQQFRQVSQPQQFRQVQPAQPSFQIERSYPVATFELPIRSGRSDNVGGISNTRSNSRLIDYPFTVEVSRSSGSSGYGNGYSNTGSSW